MRHLKSKKIWSQGTFFKYLGSPFPREACQDCPDGCLWVSSIPGLEIRPIKKNQEKKLKLTKFDLKTQANQQKKLNFREQHACRFKIYDQFLLKSQGFLEKNMRLC